MVLIPNSNIVVDGFKYSTEESRPEYVYFLTHMHADHYCGLTEEWDRGRIYCSKVSRTLLVRKFPGLAPLVIALELDEKHWISLTSDHSEGVSVTLIDANHCPGAVMLLFQGNMGTVLHTGDFRYREEMIAHPALQHASEGLIDIDILFLDNTYCHPRYTFPPQSTVIEQIKEIIDSERGAEIALGTNLLGKEELMIALASHYGVPMHVSEEKLGDLEAIALRPELFTKDPNETWLHQVNKSEANKLSEQLREGKRVIYLKLSVPYSLHSSYPELISFVEALKPKNITFTVPTSANSAEAADFLRKYSYKAPMKKVKSGLPNAVSGNLKRRAPVDGQAQVPAKRAKVLGSRICN